MLAVLLAHGERYVRNGADVILQSLFTAVAGAWGPPLFMICLIGAGLWLVPRAKRAPGSRLSGGGVFAGVGGAAPPSPVFRFVGGGGAPRGRGMLPTLALPRR